MEIDFFSYDTAGRPEWHLKQFEPEGITSSNKGRVDLLAYPRYDLTGKLLTQNIDLGFNDTLDIQHHYRFNSFGQLEAVYVNRTLIEGAGQKVVDYQYDPATGAVAKTRFFVYSKECNRSFVADSIVYDRDPDQDRLTRIRSRFFDYQLFYEDQNPNGTGWLAGLSFLARNVEYNTHWNGNINGIRASYNLPQGAEVKDFVASGGIDLDGELPMNPNGGQIGEAYIHGFNGMVEAINQFRGAANCQVKSVEHALVTGGPALPTSGMILSAI